MNINKVTITGADDKVNHEDLIALSKQYPFVEWGILFSQAKEGQPRYPQKEWVAKFIDFIEKNNINLSAHLCGQYSRDILEKNFTYFLTICSVLFKRIQINYNFKYSHNYNLETLQRWTAQNAENKIILQYNKSNSTALVPFPNLNILYDSSGGRGKEISDIKPPFDGYYTGYSGGITPDNIEAICQQISGLYGQTDVWIDMENGIRTNNEFDLDKVEKVLRLSEPFINKSSKNSLF